MTYTVKEIFKTIQGEGAMAGNVAVFCRFSGCNLWSGREIDRATAQCKFCDTDFFKGVKYASPQGLAEAIEMEWGEGKTNRMVVLTGGEPALQVDHPLVKALREKGFFIAIETNGTVTLRSDLGLDWVCVSPKAGTKIVVRSADELKVVVPQEGMDLFALAELIRPRRRSVQPMDGPAQEENTRKAIAFCLANPAWTLSLQTHKFAGIP